MRREGRQHGVVLTFPVEPFLTGDLRPRSKKVANQVKGPYIGGIYAKVPSKPTNSSKYTSRCGRPRCRGCHDHPVTKARPKAKGKHKHKNEMADFCLERDCHGVDEASELNCDLDDGGDLDNGDDSTAEGVADGVDVVVCRESGGGDCEDEGWVLVQERNQPYGPSGSI